MQESLFTDYDGGFGFSGLQPVKPIVFFRIEECELISMSKHALENLEQTPDDVNDPLGYSKHSTYA